ncbi:MAG: hypothetical protein JSU04_19105 [Bdellovibrionales bacterium]|nr:hypothetical protein [Bdellovibrionales bacterium]
MLRLILLLSLLSPVVHAQEEKRVIAETRQEQDQIQRERERGMHLRPQLGNSWPAQENGPGFYPTQSRLTGSGGFMKNSEPGMNFTNDLRWSFGCSGAGVVGEIPAKFKNVTWRIKGKAPTTNIDKGITQTDQGGLAVVVINSNLKDLSEVTFELTIEGQTKTVVAGTGPYVFSDLPMSACTASAKPK